jgi:hypothetical protein
MFAMSGTWLPRLSVTGSDMRPATPFSPPWRIARAKRARRRFRLMHKAKRRGKGGFVIHASGVDVVTLAKAPALTC